MLKHVKSNSGFRQITMACVLPLGFVLTAAPQFLWRKHSQPSHHMKSVRHKIGSGPPANRRLDVSPVRIAQNRLLDLVETELFIMQRDKQVYFRGCAGLRSSCSGRIRMANRGTRLRARHRTNTYRSPRRMGSYDRRICPRSGGPSAACGRRRRKTRTPRTAPRC